MLFARWAALEKHLWQLADPLITFAVALAATLLVRHLVLRSLRRQSRGPGSFPAVLLDTVGFPSVLWSLAASLELALRFAELTPSQILWAGNLIEAFVIISITLVAASIGVRMITVYGERQGMPFAVAGLSRTLVRIVAFSLGAVAVLGSLGLHVTPLLATLGVGGLAVALALQDTLANFFAGLHILVERPLAVGDLIRLENGQEGTVSDIGWRTTRVRTGSNDMVVIPNTKITSGILVNYSLPERRTAAEIAVMVAHEADADEVARIIFDELPHVEGVLKQPAPVLLCDPGVLSTHLQLKLIVQVASRNEQGQVQSDIRMRLLRRFRAAGIPLPTPERAPLRAAADANRG